ncbi:MAG: hypothetical protein CSA62_08820 [Planctomycetota bacterium]|nr:MAG: hypothetical protein CSA62_08820 [Planctomycetota bacterium]
MLQVQFERAFGRALPFALFCLLSLSCSSPPSEADPSAVTPGQPLGEFSTLGAEEALRAGEPEKALDLLDPMLAASRGWAPEKRAAFELLRGKTNMALAQQCLKNPGSGNLYRSSLEDAKIAFSTASELLADSPAPRIALAEAQRMTEDWQGVNNACSEAIKLLGGRQHLSGQAAERALELRSEACLRMVLAENKAEASKLAGSRLDLAQSGLRDCARLQQLQPKKAEPYVTAAALLRAGNESDKALKTLQQGVRSAPAASKIHEALQRFYARAGGQRACVGFYRNLERELQQPSAMVAWFSGQAALAYADELRSGGAIEAALRRYDLAFEAFGRCMQLEPNYSGWSKLKQAIARISQARMYIEDDKTEQAEKLLDTAYEISPAIAAVNEDGNLLYSDGLGKDYRGGIVALGAQFAGMAGERLEHAVRFWRKITARHSDWGFAWNNLGFACRDLGVRRSKSKGGEGAGKKSAKELWEESYAAYEKAVHYSPEDPRIVNDCGLMLIYHLYRNYDRANELFERAIELGREQLDELGPKTQDESKELASKRRDLEEATGDAWENLAKSSWEHGKDAKKARAALKEAQKYFPYKRRGGVRKILASIEAANAEKQSVRVHQPPQFFAMIRPDAQSEGAPSEIAQARSMLLAGEAEKALDLIEPLLSSHEEDPELWYLAGASSLLFAQQSIAAKRRGVEANLIDAVLRLKKADTLTRALDGGSSNFGTAIHVLPVTCAIEALLLQGKSSEAAELGARHATHLDSLGLELPKAVFARFALRRGEAAAQAAIAAKQAGKKDAKQAIVAARDALTRARSILTKLGKAPLPLQRIEKQAQGPLALRSFFTAWKNLELWDGKPAGAIRVLAQGAELGSAEDAGTLIGMIPPLVMQNSNSGDLTLANLAIEWSDKVLAAHAEDPTLLWWSGYLHYAVAFVARKSSKAVRALQELEAGIAKYRMAMEKRPDFANSSKFRIAEAMNAQGAILMAKGEKEKALKTWLAAIKLWPAIDQPKDFLSNRSPRDEAFIYAMSFPRQGNELRGAEILEAIGQCISNDWEAFNNAALMLRDLCERQGARRNPKPFIKTLQRSYQNYRKALRINPSDVRLSNDTALIDIYYLKENRQHSEETLRLAIRRGKSLLSDPPKNHGEKQNLEEAVGDCMMNLGLLLMEQPASYQEAKSFLTESLNYYPKRRRASGAHLRRLQRLIDAEQKKQDAEKRQGEGGGGR